MRTLELSQALQAMHSLNPTSWPVMCLLYAFLLTPWTMTSNDRLHACYPRAGLLLLLVNAIVPIVTISLFALVHEDTNIFSVNSTHFGYRLLEFNVGVCFFACSLRQVHTRCEVHAPPVVAVTFLLAVCSCGGHSGGLLYKQTTALAFAFITSLRAFTCITGS